LILYALASNRGTPVRSRPAAGASATRIGESPDLSAEATVADMPRAVPHSPQNRLPTRLSARHFGQRFASGVPHSPQNFLLEGFSAPHFEQRISASPPARALRPDKS